MCLVARSGNRDRCRQVVMEVLPLHSMLLVGGCAFLFYVFFVSFFGGGEGSAIISSRPPQQVAGGCKPDTQRGARQALALWLFCWRRLGAWRAMQDLLTTCACISRRAWPDGHASLPMT